MMKMVKPLLMIFIMTLICCSYSLGQTPIVIGAGGISGGAPGTYGIATDGAGVFPIGAVTNGMANLAGTQPYYNIVLHEFVCNSMSACGEYPLGLGDNSAGGIAYIGGVKSGAAVSIVERSAVNIVSTS